MSKTFNDINLPGFSSGKTKEEPRKKFITGVDDGDSEKDKKPEDEVKLLSSVWKPGPKGFQYNEKCFLEVKAEYLKETIRARILGKLFTIYNGVEEDLNQVVEGFIDKETGIALMEIKHLWFSKDHYAAWLKDKSTPCSYKIKEISHSRGANTIGSDELKMPRNNFYLRLDIDPNDIANSSETITLFSTDAAKKINIVKTIKDDILKSDTYLDLLFEELDPSLKYTLDINIGKDGETHQLFTDQMLFEKGGVDGSEKG